MLIQNSQVQLTAQHTSLSQHRVTQQVRAQAGPVIRPPDTQVTLSEQARHHHEMPRNHSVDKNGDTELDQIQDPKVRLIANLVGALTGKKIKLNDLAELGRGQPHSGVEAPSGPPPPRSPAGPNMSIQRTEFTYQLEQTEFSTKGQVSTADGKTIDFELSLSMSREFLQVSQSEVRVQQEKQLKDPLVLNFSGNAAQLSNSTFSFDLNNDGSEEQVFGLMGNSGFLVFDKNQNGQVDNGSELFGALTGDGFAELAQYDDDHNGWIDEADSVFSALQTWNPNNSENGTLSSLSANNIGALYLGQTSTPFQLTDQQNQLLGQIRQTGVYLTEEGKAGTMQQIDIVV